MILRKTACLAHFVRRVPVWRRWLFVALTAGAALSGCGTTSQAPEGTQPAAATAAPPATEQTSPALVAEGQKSSASIPSVTSRSGPTRSACTRSSRRTWTRRPRSRSGSRWTRTCCPPGILEKVDLKSPATTVALLKMNAVVGLQATVDANNHITRLGVTCALCHSTVDNSVMPGIGRRKDGWPNRDLNVGAIIALSPALSADKKAVYTSWGPGKYDPRYNQDGKNTPLVLPPAYGLAQVTNETYTAEGPISYWNAYVAVTQMGGQGNFSDPRLGIDVKHSPDMVSRQTPGAARVPAQPAGASTSGRKRRCRGRRAWTRAV